MKATTTVLALLLVLTLGAGIVSAQDGTNPSPFPTFMPPSEDALTINLDEAMLQEGDINLQRILETYGENNPEALAAISGFAAGYFGAPIEPVFAQKRGNGILANSEIVGNIIAYFFSVATTA